MLPDQRAWKGYSYTPSPAIDSLEIGAVHEGTTTEPTTVGQLG
jgi:hypothetical protein